MITQLVVSNKANSETRIINQSINQSKTRRKSERHLVLPSFLLLVSVFGFDAVRVSPAPTTHLLPLIVFISTIFQPYSSPIGTLLSRPIHLLTLLRHLRLYFAMSSTTIYNYIYAHIIPSSSFRFVSR